MFIFNPNTQNTQNNGINISINSDVKSFHDYDEAIMLNEENKKLKNENELLKYLKKTYESKISSLKKTILEYEKKIKKLNEKLNFFVDEYYNIAKERNEKTEMLNKMKKDYEEIMKIKEKEILNLTKLLKEKYEKI